MDPVALICRLYELSTLTTEYREGKQDLHDWYAFGGFHPKVRDVVEVMHRQRSDLPDGTRDHVYNINNSRLVTKLVKTYGCTLK